MTEQIPAQSSCKIDRWTLHHVSGDHDRGALAEGPLIWRGAGEKPVDVISEVDLLAAIDAIEREQYIEGGRCGDFKAALDAVREALR